MKFSDTASIQHEVPFLQRAYDNRPQTQVTPTSSSSSRNLVTTQSTATTAEPQTETSCCQMIDSGGGFKCMPRSTPMWFYGPATTASSASLSSQYLNRRILSTSGTFERKGSSIDGGGACQKDGGNVFFDAIDTTDDHSSCSASRAVSNLPQQRSPTTPGSEGFDMSVNGVVVTKPLAEYLMPAEGWDYTPSGSDIISGNLRFLFTNVTLPEKDIAVLHALESFLNTDSRFYAIPGNHMVWLRQYFIRALYSAGFDLTVAADYIWAYYCFRLSPELPVRDDEAQLALDLEKGGCYWFGRDASLRPQLFIRLQGLDELDRDIARITRCLIFCAEFFLRYLAVAGKFETWCVIFDCGGRGLTKIPPTLVTTIMGTMHTRYKGRCYRIYIIDFPRWYGWLASWVMSVVPANSSEKLRFISSDWCDEFRTNSAPHQLEKKYGGTSPNLNIGEFYPFHFPPGPFNISATPRNLLDENLLSKQKNSYVNLTNEILTGTVMLDLPSTISQ